MFLEEARSGGQHVRDGQVFALCIRIAQLPAIATIAKERLVTLGAIDEMQPGMEFDSAHAQGFAHAKMVAIAPIRLTVRMQRPAERAQLAVRQVLEVDTEGKLDSRLQRFEAGMLSIIRWNFTGFFLDRGTYLLKREILVGTQAQPLMPVELMASNGGFLAIIVVQPFLLIRMLLRQIMLECCGLWRRQYPGMKGFPGIRPVGLEYGIRHDDAACIGTPLITLRYFFAIFFSFSSSFSSSRVRTKPNNASA